MTPLISLITPTADQPTGIALASHYLQRQTIYGQIALDWIVVDDGDVAAAPALPCTHLRRVREPDCSNAQSLCRNLLTALPHAHGDYVLIWEHDDWYASTHLEVLLTALQAGARIVGDGQQRYYNVDHRRWTIMRNFGASLCQTGFVRDLLPQFQQTVAARLAANHYSVDAAFWQTIPVADWVRDIPQTVVGIKGLPGRHGIGLGHRPERVAQWTADPALQQLRLWIGDDADRYESFYHGRGTPLPLSTPLPPARVTRTVAAQTRARLERMAHRGVSRSRR